MAVLRSTWLGRSGGKIPPILRWVSWMGQDGSAGMIGWHTVYAHTHTRFLEAQFTHTRILDAQFTHPRFLEAQCRKHHTCNINIKPTGLLAYWLTGVLTYWLIDVLAY